MPNLARWLGTGSHRLVGWETDMSSQTSASQGGILLGNNHNLPAFRWYDRAAKEIRSSSDPKFLAGLEKTLSSGNGLLVEDGASRGNLFSGDAPYVMTTASTILDHSRFHSLDFLEDGLDCLHGRLAVGVLFAVALLQLLQLGPRGAQARLHLDAALQERIHLLGELHSRLDVVLFPGLEAETGRLVVGLAAAARAAVVCGTRRFA